MAETTLLSKCKLARRISNTAYDPEIERLIAAAKADLGFADVTDFSETADCLDAIEQAIITYVLMSFGEPSNYEQLKRAYDEMKTQLQVHLINAGGDEP